MILKDKLAVQVPVWRERVKKLLAEGGDVKVGDVTIKQVYGGMRDVKSLVTDISYVDPEEGIRLRGFTIPELFEKLPRLQGTEMPLVGGLYYLLLVGEIPSLEEALEVEEEWKQRGQTPKYVYDVLCSMPANAQPITWFGTTPFFMFEMKILEILQGNFLSIVWAVVFVGLIWFARKVLIAREKEAMKRLGIEETPVFKTVPSAAGVK
jgi:hypothetical protein